MFVLQLDGSSFFFVTFENLRENLEPEGGFGIQLISNSTKGLFIYYVITDRGEGSAQFITIVHWREGVCQIYYYMLKIANTNISRGAQSRQIGTWSCGEHLF